MNNDNASIETSAMPLPSNEKPDKYPASALTTTIFLGLSLVFLGGPLVDEVVKDREFNQRSLLKLSGMNFFTYYLSFLFYHFIYYVPTLIALAITLAVVGSPMTDNPAITFLFIVTLIFAIPLLLIFSYSLSFMYAKAEKAVQWNPMVLILLSLLPFIVVGVLYSAGQEQAGYYTHSGKWEKR